MDTKDSSSAKKKIVGSQLQRRKGMLDEGITARALFIRQAKAKKKETAACKAGKRSGTRRKGVMPEEWPALEE